MNDLVIMANAVVNMARPVVQSDINQYDKPDPDALTALPPLELAALADACLDAGRVRDARIVRAATGAKKRLDWKNRPVVVFFSVVGGQSGEFRL